MQIGIVGGGMMGLSLAERLSRQGHAVTVFEAAEQLGGLATHQDFGPFFWDRFYHIILPSDSHLIGYFQDIGLGDKLRWNRTLTGLYVDQRLYSISSNIEFLKFPLVGLFDKFRLAFTLLYCSRINDWQRLEKIPVEAWLIKLCGSRLYERIWKPILLAKLGENYQRVSAAFIWGYIKRMFSARDASASKEYLGHVSGGYKAVFERLADLITDAGGTIRTRVDVKHISARPEGGIWIEHGEGRDTFDRVIFTGPINVLQKVVAPSLMRVTNATGSIEYLGVVCMVLVTRSPLVPFYVVNIADDQIPFTGVVGMSNVVSTDETAGYHLTYLPKYVLSDDPLLRAPDEELQNLFFDGLKRMFPEWDSRHIESVHIHRAFKVQPLQVLNYSTLVPNVSTTHPDFFVLNTTQLVKSTLNNNEVVRAVGEFIDNHAHRFQGGSE